jgi:protein required for attachment to host cells
MKAPITLYLVAAEAGFALYQGERPKDLTRIAQQSASSAPPGTGTPHGTSHGHTGPGGASFTVGHDESDSDALARAELARDAMATLDRIWTTAKADRIVIAAGPKMLGALRDAMPKHLAGFVAAELPKDLLNIPEHDLARHLTV